MTAHSEETVRILIVSPATRTPRARPRPNNLAESKRGSKNPHAIFPVAAILAFARVHLSHSQPCRCPVPDAFSISINSSHVSNRIRCVAAAGEAEYSSGCYGDPEEVLRLYREVYFDLSMRHFHEKRRSQN